MINQWYYFANAVPNPCHFTWKTYIPENLFEMVKSAEKKKVTFPLKDLSMLRWRNGSFE